MSLRVRIGCGGLLSHIHNSDKKSALRPLHAVVRIPSKALEGFNIGASIITYIILGVPYYNYTIKDPKTLF